MTANRIDDDWISTIFKDTEKEMKESRFPFMLLQGNIRSFVWKLCDHLGVDSHGVPAQACRFMEHYLYKINYNYIHYNKGEFNVEMCMLHPEVLSIKFSLMLLASIHTAVKMDTRDAQEMKYLRRLMKSLGYNFPKKMILTAELIILKSYGFKLPFWTSLNIAELLINELGLPLHILNMVEAILNTTELRRDYVNMQFEILMGIPSGEPPVPIIHLVAGALYASVVHLEIHHLLNISKLIKLTSITFSRLNCLASIILSLAN